MIMNYGIFSVLEVFTIKGRGVVAAGEVAEGTFQAGDDVVILRQDGSEVKSKINSIEIFGVFPYAAKGDMVGLLLADILIEDINFGDLIKR